MTTLYRLLLTLGCTLLLATATLAAGTPSAQPQVRGAAAVVNQAHDLLYGKNFGKAISVLKEGEARYPDNANIHNLLGYSYRNQGDYILAKKHYDEALRLDPNHLGAHEYIGEMYLKLDQPEMAKHHLQKLEEICGECEEYSDLKTAIEMYNRR